MSTTQKDSTFSCTFDSPFGAPTSGGLINTVTSVFFNGLIGAMGTKQRQAERFRLFHIFPVNVLTCICNMIVVRVVFPAIVLSQSQLSNM